MPHLIRDHLRDVPWEYIFKLSASAASEFCEWVQVEIDVYIPHRKYQVKPHSSPWFSAAGAAVIVHRNHFFPLYQQNKPFLKVKFRHASNCCKRVHHFPETWLPLHLTILKLQNISVIPKMVKKVIKNLVKGIWS